MLALHFNDAVKDCFHRWEKRQSLCCLLNKDKKKKHALITQRTEREKHIFNI